MVAECIVLQELRSRSSRIWTSENRIHGGELAPELLESLLKTTVSIISPHTSCQVRKDRFLGTLLCDHGAEPGDIVHAKASLQFLPALHDDWNAIGKPCVGSDRSVR